MSKTHKKIVVERISQNGAKFDSANAGVLICPTCLRRIPIASAAEISHAHILPRSAGGKLTTYVCRACNSFFGKNQDHWFGEYLYLADGPKGLLATRKQRPTFTVNGVRVTGEVKDDGQALDFLIYKNLMSPKALEALRAAETPGKVEINVEIPILQETQLVKVGFLTAGYLLWFKELGYSWVLQGNMQSVRSQILNPNSQIISDFVFDAGAKYFEKPWVGFFELGHDYLPCAGIADRLVLFPSFSAPGIYEKVSKLRINQVTTFLERIRISDQHRLPDPVGIFYKDQALVFPDLFWTKPEIARVLRYAGDGGPPEVLVGMKKSSADSRKQEVVKIRRG